MNKRRKLTTLDKLKIVMRQALCPECGQPLCEAANGEADVEFDHQHQLAMGGEDELNNIFAKHSHCHAKKTAADAHARAKVRHRLKKAERFQPKPPAAPTVEDGLHIKEWPRRWGKSLIKTRGFDKRLRKRLSGKVEVRH